MTNGARAGGSPTRRTEVRPELVGFAEDDPSLYEFRDHSGDLIYLHDADCTKIEFAPLSEELTLTFRFGDVAHVEGCVTNADVVFVLQGVRFSSCAHGGDPIESQHADYRGQVRDFFWFGDRQVCLFLTDLHLEVQATRIEYTVARHREQ